MRTLNCALWDLVPQPRMEPEPPALEGQDRSPLDHQKSPHDIFLDAAMGQSQEADIFPFVGCWLLQEGGHVAPFSAGEALHSHSFLPPCVVIAPATEATTLKDKSQCTEDGEGDGETARLLEGIIKLLDPPWGKGQALTGSKKQSTFQKLDQRGCSPPGVLSTVPQILAILCRSRGGEVPARSHPAAYSPLLHARRPSCPHCLSMPVFHAGSADLNFSLTQHSHPWRDP